MSNLEWHETSLVVVLKSHGVQVYLSLYDGYRSNLIMEIDLVRLSSCGEAWNTLPVLKFHNSLITLARNIDFADNSVMLLFIGFRI